jgi:hypothetical protein
VSLDWILHRTRHGRNRRFVKDKLDIFESASRGRFIRQARLTEINITFKLVNVLTVSRRKIINNADARALRHQSLSNV